MPIALLLAAALAAGAATSPDRDLDFLTDFIKVSAFYVEDLEDQLGEELIDFWESREHALQIMTDLIMQKAEQEESY